LLLSFADFLEHKKSVNFSNHGDLEVQSYPPNRLVRKTIFRPLGQLQHEKDLKQVDINEKAKEDGNVVKQLKRFGDALAQVIGPQPDDVTDLPSYFQGVEAQFTKLDVPATYQARLIHKYLVPKARALCSRMDPKVRDDYAQMKNAILKEYGLTAKCFLDKFNTFP